MISHTSLTFLTHLTLSQTYVTSSHKSYPFQAYHTALTSSDKYYFSHASYFFSAFSNLLFYISHFFHFFSHFSHLFITSIFFKLITFSHIFLSFSDFSHSFRHFSLFLTLSPFFSNIYLTLYHTFHFFSHISLFLRLLLLFLTHLIFSHNLHTSLIFSHTSLTFFKHISLTKFLLFLTLFYKRDKNNNLCLVSSQKLMSKVLIAKRHCPHSILRMGRPWEV